MTTMVSFLTTAFAQLIVIFYPGLFLFWLVVHNNIERLRPLGTRSYWVAAFAWLITSVPLLALRREIFSVRWRLPESLAYIVSIVGALAFVGAVFFLFQASRQISMRTMIGFPEVEPEKNDQPILNSGIYSKTRNPIYFGHWLIVFSSAAFSNFSRPEESREKFTSGLMRVK